MLTRTLITGILFLSLLSCSTSKKAKPCTSCPHFSYITYDTLILTVPHHNHDGMCFPMRKTRVILEQEIIIEQL